MLGETLNQKIDSIRMAQDPDDCVEGTSVVGEREELVGEGVIRPKAFAKAPIIQQPHILILGRLRCVP